MWHAGFKLVRSENKILGSGWFKAANNEQRLSVVHNTEQSCVAIDPAEHHTQLLHGVLRGRMAL